MAQASEVAPYHEATFAPAGSRTGANLVFLLAGAWNARPVASRATRHSRVPAGMVLMTGARAAPPLTVRSVLGQGRLIGGGLDDRVRVRGKEVDRSPAVEVPVRRGKPEQQVPAVDRA